MELIRAGDLRGTSHYQCVSAATKCLHAIIVTLQEIHANSGDLSSEAGGLLLTLQTCKGIIILHALKRILQPLSILAKQLQTVTATLATMQKIVATARLTLTEIRDKSLYEDDITLFLQYHLLKTTMQRKTDYSSK